MAQDSPREGRQLPGAITSEEERDGIELVMIQIVEGQVEVELTVAPAGDVRVVAMNRGLEAVGLHIGRQDAPRSTVVHLREIHPGDSAESVVDLDPGDYVVTASDLQGHPHSTAMLIVQPQQGLLGSGEAGAARG
ncbi:MAG: hypothetical protein R3B59_00580 [Dehalococcoidia bacterium]